MNPTAGLASVLSLVGSLAASGPASARDTWVASFEAPSGAGRQSSPLPDMPHSTAIAAALQALPGSKGSARSETDAVDLDESDDVKVSDLCEKECGTVRKIRRLPRVIVENLAGLPVLGAFVVPVTTGVTIEAEDGLSSVTFALKPTKFARGTGLVAIGRF